MMDLLQQALEALELSAPLPGHEELWSAAINALYEAKDGQALAVPAGYVLVPTEPTPLMVQVAREAEAVMLSGPGIYRAMLAAAPKEPRNA